MEDLELFIYLLRCSYCEKFWAYLAIETMLFILFYFGSTNTRILVLVRGSGCNNFQSTKLIGCSPVRFGNFSLRGKALVLEKKEESLDGGSSLFILDAVVGKE